MSRDFFHSTRRWLEAVETPPEPPTPVTPQQPPWHLDWVAYRWDQSSDTSESTQTILCDRLWIHTN